MAELRDHVYLSDGVYAAYDGFQIWIWTSDGVRESEKIAIDPITLSRLKDFADRYWDIQ